MKRRIAGRHAGHDDYGNALSDSDVLSPEELAEDYGWVPRQRRSPQPPDPRTLAELVELQQAVAR